LLKSRQARLKDKEKDEKTIIIETIAEKKSKYFIPLSTRYLLCIPAPGFRTLFYQNFGVPFGKRTPNQTLR